MHVEGVSQKASETVVRIENDFDFLSNEYEELFQRSGATGFQNPLWLHSIYTVLAPGVGAQPHIITVRRGSGELKMLIPLVLQRSLKVRILQPADLGVSDYNCIIADCDTLAALPNDEDFQKQICDCLDAGDILIFRKMQQSSAATAAILGEGTQTPNENAGYEVMLEGETFEEWQKTSLKKSFRKDVQRRLRRLEADHGAVEFVTFTTAAEIEAAIRFIRDHRAARFKDDLLLQDTYLEFYLHYAIEGASSGVAVTSGLIVDGVLVSADFGIFSAGAYYSILCAAKLEEYGKYSPGYQSLLALIRRSHEKGEVRIDLGIGNSRQKGDFGAVEIPLYNLTVSRSMSGQVVSLVYNQAKPLKTVLRNLGGIR